MSYETLTPKLIAELIRLRGSLGVNSRGASVPALKPTDMMGALGLYTSGLIAAVARAADRIVPSPFVTAEGAYNKAWEMIVPVIEITPQRYVAAAALPGVDSYKRAPVLTPDERQSALALPEGVTFEPVRNASALRSEQLEQIAFLRQTVVDYQNAIDAITPAVQMYGMTGRPDLASCSNFLDKLRNLGAGLDTLAENPPTTWRQDIAGALDAASRASGEAAADIANTVGSVGGKVAGGFASGFLDSANLLTLVIAGIVVYKVIP